MATTKDRKPPTPKKSAARKSAATPRIRPVGASDSSLAPGAVIVSGSASSGSVKSTTAGGMPVGPVVVPPLSVVAGVVPAEGAEAVVLRKKQFVARVIAASGVKKKEARDVVEAALAIMGDALSAGEELNLPPLGRIKINRTKADGEAEILILRLRRGGSDPAAKEGLAETDEDD